MVQRGQGDGLDEAALNQRDTLRFATRLLEALASIRGPVSRLVGRAGWWQATAIMVARGAHAHGETAEQMCQMLMAEARLACDLAVRELDRLEAEAVKTGQDTRVGVWGQRRLVPALVGIALALGSFLALENNPIWDAVLSVVG